MTVLAAVVIVLLGTAMITAAIRPPHHRSTPNPAHPEEP